jgi:ubiquinone/menaquinone biosynthesis C-methylase UbiE
LPGTGAPTTKRFEGLYGAIYDRVIQAPSVRRAIFGAWGSADPLRNLDAFVADAVEEVGAESDAVLLDLPSGGGTLLPLLARQRFRGIVVEVDLAGNMIARALRVHDALQPAFRTAFLRSDALALPLREGIVDVVVSVNGLHVVPDPGRFLSEAARVTKPGGRLWLITPVYGPSIRSRMILKAANSLSITPKRPPTRAGLRRLLDEAGFDEVRDYGGESIAGFGLLRRSV